MSVENVVDRETAEADLARFAELMDLDLDAAQAKAAPKGDVKGDSNHIEEAKETLLTAIMRGRACVNDDGEIVYTPQLGATKPITFKEPTGATYTSAKGKQGHESLNAMMASMTGEIPSRFANMKKRDLTVCQAIAALFLA